MPKSKRVITVAVCGVPRGFQSLRADRNWLQEKHKEQILAVWPSVKLLEIPAHQVNDVQGIEVLLAEGGNRVHYPGELDWDDYGRFFTPTLQWVQLCSTGFSDNITPQILNGSVTLTNAPGLHTIPIAESVIAAMLDHAKNLKQRRIDQKNRAWNRLKNDELFGKTVLVIGLGRIGKRVARLCQAFDMRGSGTKRRVEPVAHVDTVFPAHALAKHLPMADYVVIAVPHTPETEDMLGTKEFRAMKSSAYLINVGRGRVVKEHILIAALQEGWISGAYLDAFVNEPLPVDCALWDLENTFIVPHDSHSSPYIGVRLIDLFCENLTRYVKGEPLQHICDLERGY